MRLTILGSGTMVPSKGRYPSSYLFEHEETQILLDCGALTLTRLLEHDVDFQSISAVCITHFHSDHFSHLMPLVHARFVDDLYEGQSHRELSIFAPETFSERWQKLREVFWPEPKEDYPLRVCEGPMPDVARVGQMHIRSFPVRHVQWFPSVGYRIEAEGKALAYTGDLGPEQSEETLQGLAEADLLIIEAAAPKPSESHLTADQAVQLGKRVGAKRIVLTHLRDSIISLAEDVAAREPNLVTLAQDGLTFDL